MSAKMTHRNPIDVPLIKSFVLTLFFAGMPHGSATAQEQTIDVIDTYGLDRVNQKAVLDVAGVHVGDRAPNAAQIKGIVEKLETIPGVQRSAATIVVAPRTNAPPQRILYIGIHEAGRPVTPFRATPTADVVLPNVVVENYRAYERTFLESVIAGNFTEDDSLGYALMGNEAARNVQRKLVPLAELHCDRLIDVLRTAKSNEQRAMAAAVIGYSSDKKRVAGELEAAMRDPDDKVRNNAMRSLAVILSYAQKHPDLAIEVSSDWCFDMLESVVWTDRNKALLVFIQLTASGEDAVISRLRKRSLKTLIEMARWKAESHAMMAFMVLGRVAGMKDQEVLNAWIAGNRDAVIERAVESKSAPGSQ